MIRVGTFLVFIFCLLAPASGQNIRYVDSNQPSTTPQQGNTWNKAHRTLQEALDAAQIELGQDLICMAEGNYIHPQQETYEIHHDVVIVGGYRPGDYWRNPTGGSRSTIIEGEVGNLNTLFDNIPRGFFIVAARVQLRRLWIKNFFLDHDNGPGAGIYAEDAHLTLIDVWIQNCTAERGVGGGLAFSSRDGVGNLRISNSAFIQNEAGNGGGGLHVELAQDVQMPGVEMIVDRTLFWGNLAKRYLAVHWAHGAGAYVLMRNTDVVISNSAFVQNVATPRPNQLGSFFDSHGGAIYAEVTAHGNDDARLDIWNITSTGNVADRGADIRVSSDWSGHFSQHGSSEARIHNSILWSTYNPPGLLNGTLYPIGTSFVDHSAVYASSVPLGEGNTISDPMFVSFPHNLRLNSLSPLVDAGAAGNPFSLDFSGAPRVVGTIDIGAYEQ